MTHKELVTLAMRWLDSLHFRVVLSEPGFRDECPDAIGFKQDFSLLVECKASRSDFLADKKKPFRQNPAQGVGTVRVYLTNPDIIRPEELPEKWWHLEALSDNAIRIVRGYAGYPEMDKKAYFQEKNYKAEADLLYSWCYRKLEGCLKSVPRVKGGLQLYGKDDVYVGQLDLFKEEA